MTIDIIISRKVANQEKKWWKIKEVHNDFFLNSHLNDMKNIQ